MIIPIRALSTGVEPGYLKVEGSEFRFLYLGFREVEGSGFGLNITYFSTLTSDSCASRNFGRRP